MQFECALAVNKAHLRYLVHFYILSLWEIRFEILDFRVLSKLSILDWFSTWKIKHARITVFTYLHLGLYSHFCLIKQTSKEHMGCLPKIHRIHMPSDEPPKGPCITPKIRIYIPSSVLGNMVVVLHTNGGIFHLFYIFILDLLRPYIL